MIRFLFSMAAYLALAAGFVSAVVDGTRSIAAGGLSITNVGGSLGARLPAIQSTIYQLHPLLWDPVAVRVMRLPLWLALGAIGLVLLWATRRRPASSSGLGRY